MGSARGEPSRSRQPGSASSRLREQAGGGGRDGDSEAAAADDSLDEPTLLREVARVADAVARGDLTQSVALDAGGRPLRGELLRTARTVNRMVERLGGVASELTRAAREVGVEGKLAGQARVKGVTGAWKDLSDDVNLMIAGVTHRVRGIAAVVRAVAAGDLERKLAVEATGEIAALENDVNEMIVSLKEATLRNADQDWLKTNLAKFSRILQGQKDVLVVARLVLSELAPVVAAQHGVFYAIDTSREEPYLRLLASYAYRTRKRFGSVVRLGEGLVGRAALAKEKILSTSVLPDEVDTQVTSGLGETAPLNVLVLPVVFEGVVKAVIELGSFDRFSATRQAFLDQLMEFVGIVLNTIEANTRTEDLLAQARSLANELQLRQHELQRSNAELEEKATLLAARSAEVVRKT